MSLSNHHVSSLTLSTKIPYHKPDLILVACILFQLFGYEPNPLASVSAGPLWKAWLDLGDICSVLGSDLTFRWGIIKVIQILNKASSWYQYLPVWVHCLDSKLHFLYMIYFKQIDNNHSDEKCLCKFSTSE